VVEEGHFRRRRDCLGRYHEPAMTVSGIFLVVARSPSLGKARQSGCSYYPVSQFNSQPELRHQHTVNIILVPDVCEHTMIAGGVISTQQKASERCIVSRAK